MREKQLRKMNGLHDKKHCHAGHSQVCSISNPRSLFGEKSPPTYPLARTLSIIDMPPIVRTKPAMILAIAALSASSRPPALWHKHLAMKMDSIQCVMTRRKLQTPTRRQMALLLSEWTT